MGKIHERFKANQSFVHKVKRRITDDRPGMTSADMIEMFDRLDAQDVCTKPKAVLMMDSCSMVADKVKKKGDYQGLCNVTACQSPHEVEYYNKYTQAFYCPNCAYDINASNRRFKDCDGGAPFVNHVTAEEAAKL